MLFCQKMTASLLLIGCVLFLIGAVLHLSSEDDSFQSFVGKSVACFGGASFVLAICFFVAAIWVT